jgi:hypothetical protein
MNTQATVIALVTLSSLAGLAQAGQWPLSPQDGVLVLRNGSALAGRITSVGDHYIVTFGNKSEVKLPAAQVEMCCANLEEAYNRKREALAEGEVKPHLRLATWCLNQGLFARAADQALIAFSIDPDHPDLASFERRLLFVAKSTLAGQTTSAPEEVDTKVANPPSSLDALPSETVEQFTQKVQPILLNRCAANACHGIRSENGLRLVTPPKGMAMPYRYTHKNLQTALAFIDRVQPELSRLITAPSRPHGGLEMPVFDTRDLDQQQQLFQWAQWVAGKTLPADSYPARSPDTYFMPQPMTTFGLDQASETAGGTASGSPRGGMQIPQAEPRQDVSGTIAPGRSLPPRAGTSDPPASPAVANPPASTRDPLDPAIFNQRFSQRTYSTAESASPVSRNR